MSWKSVLLGDLIEITSGFAFKSGLFNPDGAGLPLVRIRDVVRGYSETFYDGPFQEQFRVSNGDILIGMDGEFNTAKWTGGPALLNQRVCRIDVVSPRLDSEYLFWFLPNALKEIENRTAFVTVKHLSAKDVRAILIPLPPLDEQRRIASILDQADALRRKRQSALDHLNQLGQAIFIEMFGDGFEAPTLTRLESVASQIDYGLTASAEPSGAGPKFLRITDIQEGSVNWDNVPVCTATLKQIRDNSLQPGDIVFARTGATTGKSFLVTDCPQNSVFASYLIRVRPSELINPDYLFGFFQSRAYWAQISGMAQGAAQPGVNSTKLKELLLPLPPMKDQIEYSTAVKGVSNQLRYCRQHLGILKGLFTSLQNRAFRGEL